jgi:hypothetical protein
VATINRLVFSFSKNLAYGLESIPSTKKLYFKFHDEAKAFRRCYYHDVLTAISASNLPIDIQIGFSRAKHFTKKAVELKNVNSESKTFSRRMIALA